MDDGEGMGMGEPTFTDGEYWDRLNSNAYDDYDDLEALADAWEDQQYGPAKATGGGARKQRRDRITNRWVTKTMQRVLAPVVEVESTAVLYPPDAARFATAAPAASAPPRRSTAPVAAPAPPMPAAPPASSTAQQFRATKAYDVARQRNMMFSGQDTATVTKLPSADEAVLVAAYDHMMETFAEKFATRYHGSLHDIADLAFDRPVPNYFANVGGGQTISRRKALSMAGLRNLVRYGPAVYNDLSQRNFSGIAGEYGASKGLSLMRMMTGNVVDLDTTVLRCDNVILEVINISNKHKGLPTFSSPSAFSGSEQASQIAVSCATPLLARFIERMKLTPGQAQARNVDPSQISNPIPLSHDNTTRGHTPVWHYMNAGQDSFHVNVPCMEDVIGALLRAPFACVEIYAAIHMQHGQDAAELQRRLSRFFEDCVADSCFNMKWKAIEEFAATMAHEGTIVDVLQKVQMSFQEIFTAEFFDNDTETQDNEIREMWKLVDGKRGRDKAGALRPITRQDVTTWVHAAAAGKPIVI